MFQADLGLSGQKWGTPKVPETEAWFFEVFRVLRRLEKPPIHVSAENETFLSKLATKRKCLDGERVQGERALLRITRGEIHQSQIPKPTHWPYRLKLVRGEVQQYVK